jgi:CRP-like cAMP-binding protein
MSDQYDQAITTFPLFAGYTLHGARMVREQGQVQSFKPGDVIFREGDEATIVLLLLTGKLEVIIQRAGKDLVLTDAGPGTILGELAVLCGIPRSATVRAMEESVVLQWETAAFRRMLLSDANLSQRIFRQSLKTLIEKERSMIESLMAGKGSRE